MFGVGFLHTYRPKQHTYCQNCTEAHHTIQNFADFYLKKKGVNGLYIDQQKLPGSQMIECRERRHEAEAFDVMNKVENENF